MSSTKLSMRADCNLELGLSPFIPDDSSESRQLTIFYNGHISVSHVTHLQAKAIIMMATREMEKKLKNGPILESEPSSPSPSQSPSPSRVPSPARVPPSQAQTPSSPGLYMKRSLQRFLQKRKNRAHSPYHH